MSINDIENLLSKAKPNTQVDPRFKNNLYVLLTKGKFMDRFNLKMLLPISAIAVVAVIMLVVKPNNQNTTQQLLGGKQEIIRVGSNAFGQLNTLNAVGRGQGGGGGAENMSLSADAKMMAPGTEPAVGMGGGGTGVATPAIWYPTYFKYVYNGEPITVDSDQMDVYERQKGFGAGADLASFLERFDIGLFNISKFQSATVDYLRASENRDQGYAIDMDLKQGTLYISQNWERWPMLDYSQPTSMGEVPSDEEAIAIADQFLNEYGISKENYGTPVVQNYWRIMYERATDKNSLYVPDAVSVVYPIKIEGNEVMDEGGNKTGMFVSINARTKQVTSVGEITSQRFQASAYPTEKDTARLMKIAENGGFRSYMPLANEVIEPDAKTVTVELGTPKIEYVRMWQTINNQTKDLYVPSLVFPVTNQPTDYYTQNVIVPLIKEVLDAQQPIMDIMPMEKSIR
ncbi:MAG: hypothetical protein A3I07_01480 [Candidatus Doudnabacteria bacterium RIFCSPLOWO2_02_FULL_42_9]|uniref:Uncharacterized protein n=1 Tax=Candidatus Doudnabacteria bacterium RIFCSPHIGHO2_01_FULL_41_86 TaxID=1817821 RepID=A0A1F5N907_9BACT|nr:MAG: hypothetical protein A2717_01365 [Candidatus Doudnabacteria bacterium RIFCSPHIGHO2_01_FULL_41_86]OGE74874.1 MAG: hypothetical protein A3K07_02935 [Candidatus Doudnabacteria bacterium RIFCSPHIGHO2_01_43_10]OGE85219.1 MAG: hypothetical protein A3E28_00930 [Candidatus Doudnabacteria bacterium RIFCSPHIGHO2_12_FULL_42_22]OGE86757.1 MAG: hypothetical protein A3C49_01765 [Candidatus Doudnabacteria bacterium RIFCSPHIGHO2_02_FULL_42_25]OGE92355.1 MAG: hypothetical protein A2895_01920 [Candidatus